MSRPALTEYLQSFPFWLMDLGPTDLLNFPILDPKFGFQTISAPELQLETTEIPEGNWFFPRKVIKRGNIQNVTLTRGLSFEDADFWRWINMAVTGNTYSGFGSSLFGGPTYRRHLLIIQYFPHIFFPKLSGAGGDLLAQGLAAGANVGIYAGAAALAGVDMSISTSLSLAGAPLMNNIGPFEFAARIPARAFLLKDCLPIRYKAAQDFDANSSGISVAELELSVDVFEEIALSA